MNRDRWQEIKRIFDSAMEIESGRREAFVRQACQGDAAMREQVESLLARRVRAEKFFAAPAVQMAASAIADHERSFLGRTILHYRVVEKIGQGGMGEVFLADDLSLGRKVAIKVLPRELSGDAERLARFEREARLLASFNHPNIAAIHGMERTDCGPLLVMELVEGDTLAQRIAKGPLPVDKALNACRQIAEGLEAAHGKGITHRDLKPANVMITPDGKVKLLDFGMAKPFLGRSGEENGTRSHTITDEMTYPGVILGTAAYMSPEQASGNQVDKRTDIWAFGCILFECLSGRRAFPGDSASETIARILQRTPDWEALPPETPPAVRSLLRRCLQKDAGLRLHDAADARIEISEANEVAMEPMPFWARRPVWRAIALIIGLVITFIAGAIIYSTRRNRGSEVSGVDRNRVVVAAFENRTGDHSLDNLGQQITDSIHNALRQVGEARVGGSPSGSWSVDHRRLAEVTRSGLVVAGAYYQRGGQVELQAQIVDPWAEDKMLCTFDPIRGPATDLTRAIDMLCQRVAGAVAFHVTPECALGLIKPPLLGAFREYLTGLSFFGTNYEETYRHYEKALSIDPEFYWPRLCMFLGLFNQGKYEQAEAELVMLETNLGRMTPFDRLQVRGRRAVLEGRWLEALAAWRELQTMAPGLCSFSYLRGVTEIAVNRPHDAIKSLTKVPISWAPQEPAAVSWPSLSLARAYHLAGDFEGELRIAKERLTNYPDVLELYSQQAMALAALGRLEEVDRVIDASLTVPAGSDTPVTVMVDAAYALRAHGHRERASAVGNRAISWLHSRSPGELKTRRSQLAAAFYVTERWQEARALYIELAGQDPQDISYQGCVGSLAVRQGDRAEAERIAEALRALEGRYRYGHHTYCRARIASLLGEKEKAVALLGEAFAQGYLFSIAVHHDPDFEPLWDYPPYQELIRPKG